MSYSAELKHVRPSLRNPTNRQIKSCVGRELGGSSKRKHHTCQPSHTNASTSFVHERNYRRAPKRHVPTYHTTYSLFVAEQTRAQRTASQTPGVQSGDDSKQLCTIGGNISQKNPAVCITQCIFAPTSSGKTGSAAPEDPRRYPPPPPPPPPLFLAPAVDHAPAPPPPPIVLPLLPPPAPKGAATPGLGGSNAAANRASCDQVGKASWATV